jgi:hypothetical protein
LSKATVTRLEPWLGYADLARHLDCSVRWLKSRVAEGMPSAMIAGRRKMKASEAEDWLAKEGYLVRKAA